MRALSLQFGGVLAGLLVTLLLPAATSGGGQPAPPGKARVDLHGDPLPEGVLARLGTARLRHGNGAGAAFLPDGKTILTFGADRTFRYWDIATGCQVREQRLPDGPHLGSGGVLSPNGQFAAFQEDLETFTLWDVSRNQMLHRHQLDERWSHQAAFSPNSKTVVIAHHSGTLKTWDVATGQTRALGKHKRELNTMSFAADGTLVTVCMNRELRFWDVVRGQERSQLTLPEHVYGAAVSPDGRTLAILSFSNPELDKGILFCDSTTGKSSPGWLAPDVKQVQAALFAPDGKTVAIVTKEKVVVWDPAAGKILHSFTAVQAQKLAFSADRKLLAAFGSARSEARGAVLYMWNLKTGVSCTANAPEHGHLYDLESVALAPDGRTVATACREDQTIRLWEAGTGRLLRSFFVANQVPRAMAFTSDGKHVFTGTTLAIFRWEVATGREIGRYVFSEEGKKGYLYMIHATDDGQRLLAVVRQADKKKPQGIHAWEVTSGKLLWSSSLPSNASLASYYSRFSPDGDLLALLSGKIYNPASGTELLQPAAEGKGLGRPIAFSRDGSLIAMGLWQAIQHPNLQGTETIGVQVWETATLQPVVRLGTGELAHCAFTPDGRCLITAGLDSLTRWDLATGRTSARKLAHSSVRGVFGPSFASSFALAADGQTVVTGHPDTTALIWDLTSPPSQPAAPLTAEQQESYWTDLAGADAGKAFAALARLADTPKQTTPWMRERVHPAKAPPAQELRQLLTDLDAPQFDRREKATARLTELRDVADAALREALKTQLSGEARRRLEGILAEPPLVGVPEARRHLRAVRLLEMIGTPEARQVLEKLASGVPEARLTRAASAAGARLDRSR